ncbi:MAG TPA: 3-dehydroquinate synthase [Caulobacteraceae bacterium]
MNATISVGLGQRDYQVIIGRDLIDEAGAHVRPLLGTGRVAVVMDPVVEGLHGSRLMAALKGAGITAERVVIAPGETAKSFAGLEQLCDRLLALELDRGDLVMAFGGGVVGDLAGFAAAIYKRGIDFVQMPTTLLAQVDSSVGGKTAIDTARGKNLIGAFHQPRLVIADLGLLDTLPAREMVCGYAEVLKCALLGDAEFLGWLEVNGTSVLQREPACLSHAVSRSIEMKTKIVAQDEREHGARALLNLGHTFGHAIEAESGFSDRIKHGEAVGLGCALAFRFSASLGLCSLDDARRAGLAAASAGLPARLDQIAGGPFGADALIGHMAQDKKASGGALTFILVRGVGQAFIAKGIDKAALRAFLVEEGATP